MKYKKKCNICFLKRGDIISITKVSYDLGANVQDNENKKKRLYVVISNNINNEKSPTINIACLSSKAEKGCYPMHVTLDKKDYSFLETDNIILTEQVLTINKDRVNKVISTLNEKDTSKLDKAIYIQLINEKAKKIIC